MYEIYKNEIFFFKFCNDCSICNECDGGRIINWISFYCGNSFRYCVRIVWCICKY